MPAAARTATRAFLFVEHTGPRSEDGYSPRSGPMREDVLDELRVAIRDSGGRELDGTSDSLPAVFDSASVALLCAQAMRRRVRALSAEVAVRVGLHCGEPIEIEGGRFFGSAMWTAARLCARAETDGILASSAVEALVSPELASALRSVGAVQLKGLSEPVPVFTAPPPDSTPPSTAAGTRIVSVLTVDQVGSTALIDAYGDTGARTVHAALLDVIGEAVDDHGGTPFEYGGDGMSVWFPSALDATQSAVLMQQLAFRHRRRFHDGGELHLRVAIVTGEVATIEPRSLAPLAVRSGGLGKRTGTDEVLLDPVAHRLVAARRVLAFSPPCDPEASADGARAVDWAPTAWEFAIPAGLAFRGPFVGRDAELEQLTRLWEKACSGSQRAVLLEGDSGMGKTALAAALVSKLVSTNQVATFYGRCAQVPAHPYEALTEAFSEYVGAASRADLRRALGEHAALLAKALPMLRGRLPELGSPPALEAAAEPIAMARAVSALLDGITAIAPTVLVLDDLQFAPDQLLIVLRELVRLPSRRPLLLLGLVRSPDFGVSPILAAVAGSATGATTRLTLRGLPRRDAEALMASVLGSEPAADVAHTITAESEGVPYFVLELARARLRAGTEHGVRRAIEQVETWRLDIRDVRDQVAADVLRMRRMQGEAADDSPESGPAQRLDPEGTPPLAGSDPYRGLASFEPEDADWFYGREQLTAELVAHVAVAGVLAVIGPSGSGKSSLVHAGLIPALARGAVPESEGWAVARFTPGAAPREALAAGLAPILGSAVTAVARTLGAGGIAGIAAEVSREHGRLLLVLDQAEELFTAAAEPERDAFIDLLLTALAAPGARVNLVLVGRADFYGAWAVYPALATLLQRDHVLVGAMRDDELRRAIVAPAAKAGLVVEPELTDALVADVTGEPGALPLLSTALSETWLRRRGRSLTLTGYAETGGVRRAIATMADEVYERLAPEQRGIARRLLLRLARPGEHGAADLRRRARLSELVGEDTAAAAVLAILVDARLVSTDETTAEVAHEALLREWPLLREWLAEDREGRAVHQQVSEAAFEWRQRGHDPELLYRGARLAAAEELAERHPDDLNGLERDFVVAGRRAATAELTKARRTASRLRRLSVGLAAVLVLAVVAAGMAVAQGNAAADRALTARASSLAAQSATLLDSQQDIGDLLAAAADSLRPTADSKSAVLAAANRTPELVGITTLGSSTLTISTVSEDGAVAAAEDARGAVTVFALPSGKRIRTFTSSAGTGSGASTADPPSLSPSGRFLAIRQGVQQGEAVFDVRTGRRVARLLKAEGVSLPLDDFAVYSDYSTGGQKHTYLDLRTGQPHAFADLQLPESVQIAGSAHAAVLAIGDPEQGRVRMLDLASTAPSPRPLQVRGQLLAVSPDGRLLAVVRGSPEKVTVVDAGTGRVISSSASQIGEQLWDRAIAAFDARSENLAFTGLESGNPVHVVEVRTGAQTTVAVPIPHTRIPPTFASDGAVVVLGQRAVARFRLTRTPALHYPSRTARREDTDVPKALLAADSSGRQILRAVESPTADWHALRYRLTTTGDPTGGRILVPLPGGYFDGRTAVFDSAGRRLATVEVDVAHPSMGRATIWDVSDGRPIATVGPFPVQTRSPENPTLPPLTAAIAFDRSAASLAVLTSRSYNDSSRLSAAEAQLWDLQTRRESAHIDLGEVAWGTLAPDGRSAATIGADGGPTLWDLANPGRRRALTSVGADPAAVFGQGDLLFSTNGKQLALMTPDPADPPSHYLIGRWNTTGPDRVRHFVVGITSHREAGWHALSPDARMVAVSTGRGMNVWSVDTGKRVATIAAGSDNTELLGFAQGGSTLAIWDSGVLRLADIAAGTTTTFGSPQPAPSPNVVDDDPDVLITRAGVITVAIGGDLQLMQQVVLGRAAATARICVVAGRNLTRQEWSRYVPDLPYRRLCPQWPVLAR